MNLEKSIQLDYYLEKKKNILQMTRYNPSHLEARIAYVEII